MGRARHVHDIMHKRTKLRQAIAPCITNSKWPAHLGTGLCCTAGSKQALPAARPCETMTTSITSQRMCLHGYVRLLCCELSRRPGWHGRLLLLWSLEIRQ
jgi:hypothetical protein